MNFLTWMFNEKDFKTHFSYLLKYTVIFAVLIILLAITTLNIGNKNPILLYITLFMILIIALCFLCFPLGYFWELTDKIIYRKTDIIASNIYDNKIKHVNLIEFPELNIWKFIWRGFASIIANIIMFIPYISIIAIAITNSHDIESINLTTITILNILFMLFIPALLWNYARKNSIVSTLNIFIAIDILGNSTFKYLKTIILLSLVYFSNIIIDFFVSKIFVFFFGTSIQNLPLNIPTTFGIILLILYSLIKYYYLIFVNAYILGTMMPEKNNCI